MLLQSKLVRVCNNKDSSSSIRVDRDNWNTFLGRFQLRGDIYGQGGCVELTDGNIKHAAIKRTMGGRIDQTTTNQKSIRMCVLRVGAVGPGETPPSKTAINREEDEPPRINKQMRRAKLNLAVDLTIKLCLFDDPCMEDLLDVSDSTFYEKPTSFQAGDLVFLAVIMGKDKFNLPWCNWCKYSKAEWQVDCDVNNNDMFWDINGINVQPDCNVAHSFTDACMQGVWSSPKTLIPFLRSIFSGLHAGIGIGNQLINHLKEVIDVDDENILHKEF
jgi:hypothetical protein